VAFSEKLDKLISAPTSTFAQRTRPTYPTGWEPGVLHGDDGGLTVTTDRVPKIQDEESWKAAVESLGVSVPEGYTIRLYEARYDPAAWHRDEEDGEAVTRPAWRYRFKVEPSSGSEISIDDLLDLVSKTKAKKPSDIEIGTQQWILATGDWQLGKIDGDGVEGTIQRILDSTDRSIERIKELRRLKRWPGNAVLILTGDCVEGFVSQGGGNTWRTNLTMTEQVRLYRRLVFEIVTRLAAETENLLVVAVPGNHGETVRLMGKMATRMDDSWDIDAVIAVAETLEQNKAAYSHVKFVTPGKDEGTIVLDLGGTITAIAHGHQVKGGNVPKWVAEHAKNMAPVGDAHLIITGHHHHLHIQAMGPRTWIQVPAMESESTWWREKTGEVSPPGMVSVLVGNKTWTDLAIL
jgi:predicted phosphodiesterase